MFQKVLIANRGEIAVRIHRACKEMGIRTVAVHSTADSQSMHVRLADESICIGGPRPLESYLNKQAIISAAVISGADAIHPGYGFLSENADFVQMVEDHGIAFIGPSSKHIRMMGDKIEAKRTAVASGLPVIPGSDGEIEDVEHGLKVAKKIGYPVLIKAAAGGGGRGMKVANTAEEFPSAYNIAKGEAEAAFGNGAMYLEKFLANPRHIELQIVGDKYGNVIHLYERDCSLQRRNQKVLEEAPSPALNQKEREAIGEIAVKAMKKIGYYSAGTIEFLYENGEFFFMEMNTRLQVEHPVTEEITGIDIVRVMIRVAAGEKLPYKQSDIKINGHAIECRINAEDPETFIPMAGTISQYHAPGGFGVRVDSAVYSGYVIPPYYDSMIAKVITWGHTRNSCLMRMRRALSEFVLDGSKTSIPLHLRLLSEADVLSAKYDIKWLEKMMENNKK